MTTTRKSLEARQSISSSSAAPPSVHVFRMNQLHSFTGTLLPRFIASLHLKHIYYYIEMHILFIYCKNVQSQAQAR